MIFAIVPTHQLGTRRPREEMASDNPTTGHLRLYDWRSGNIAKRAIRVAELGSTEPGVQACLLPKLFDAKVVKITDGGIHIVGFEIATVGAESIEYAQGWWAKMVL
jgi:hypothetical protein